jgi:hypothetical protein
MSAHDEDRLEDLLRQALPPVVAEPEPGRDLWPAVLRRLDTGTAAPKRGSFSAPWIDWALLAVVLVFVMSFPLTIPVFLYYL